MSDDPYPIFRTWFWTIFALFLFGMLMVFHYIKSDQAWWALFWWSLVAAFIPALIWMAFRSIRRAYTGEPQNMEYDIVSPVSCALGGLLIVHVGALLLYG